MENKVTSLKIYFWLILIMVTVRVFFIFVQPAYTTPAIKAGFSWVAIILAALLGSISIKLSKVTGFPDIWDSKKSNKQRFLIPFLWGLFLGIVIIIIDLFVPLGKVHIAFPMSIPFYLFGGIIVEIFYRLIPMVLLVWLISNLILNQRWQEKVFWTIAILHCFLEPIGDTIEIHQHGLTNEIFLFIYFIFKYANNLIPAYLFRKYGFLAAIVFRLSFYLIWHIIWGGVV